MGQMTRLGEFGESVAFLSFTPWLCLFSYLERRECTSAEASGMSGVGRQRLTGKPDYPTRLGGSASGPERQVASERQTCPRAPGPTPRMGERVGPQNVSKCPSQPRGAETPLSAPPAPRAASQEPSRPRSSGARQEDGSGGERLSCAAEPPRERRAARFSEPCARPSGGNASSPAAVAGRGLGGAGEGCKRREFEESYRRTEWPEPAVTLET